MTVIIMTNNILEHGGPAAVDPHLRVSQHPGDNFDLERVFHVIIEPSPKVTGNTGFTLSPDLRKVKEFVTANTIILLQHWEDHIDSIDVLKGIKPMMPPPDEGKAGLSEIAIAYEESKDLLRRIYTPDMSDPEG